MGRIVSYLESHGVPCWLASRDIPPRAIYADAITDAVQASAACVVVLSKASNQSKAVKRELELASHYDKAFIPIRIDATEPAAGIDYYLRNTQWMDFKRDGERALDRIVAQGDTSAPQAAWTPPRKAVPRGLWIAGAISAIALVGGYFALLSNRGAETEPAATIEEPAAESAVDFAAQEPSRTPQQESPATSAQARDAEPARIVVADGRVWRREDLADSTWWGTTTSSMMPEIGWWLGSDGIASWGRSQGVYTDGGDAHQWSVQQTAQGSTVTIQFRGGQIWTGVIRGNRLTGTIGNGAPDLTSVGAFWLVRQ